MVQVWSRNTPESASNEYFVLHRVEGLGVRVQGLGFSEKSELSTSMFGVLGLGFWVWGVGLGAWDFEFEVWVWGLGGQGSGVWVLGFGVWGLGSGV